MGIVTFLYLTFWTILLYYFRNSVNSHGIGAQVEPIASRMLTQTGLQFSSMLMALLTIMLASSAISSELETGLIHSIISRPLSRLEYVLGKFLGLLILVCIYATALFLFLLGIGGLFGLSTIISMTVFQLLSGWVIYLLVPIAMLCLTLYGSSTFKTVPNGILMIFIYILGNIGGMVEMIGKYINSETITGAGIFISLVSPFHTIFVTMEKVMLPSMGIAEDMMRGAGGLSGSGAGASVWMYVYIGIYMIGFVLLTIRKFSRRDII